MRTYILFRLFYIQGPKEKEMNRKESGFHIYPVKMPNLNLVCILDGLQTMKDGFLPYMIM